MSFLDFVLPASPKISIVLEVLGRNIFKWIMAVHLQLPETGFKKERTKLCGYLAPTLQIFQFIHSASILSPPPFLGCCLGFSVNFHSSINGKSAGEHRVPSSPCMCGHALGGPLLSILTFGQFDTISSLWTCYQRLQCYNQQLPYLLLCYRLYLKGLRKARDEETDLENTP